MKLVLINGQHKLVYNTDHSGSDHSENDDRDIELAEAGDVPAQTTAGNRYATKTTKAKDIENLKHAPSLNKIVGDVENLFSSLSEKAAYKENVNVFDSLPVITIDFLSRQKTKQADDAKTYLNQRRKTTQKVSRILVAKYFDRQTNKFQESTSINSE